MLNFLRFGKDEVPEWYRHSLPNAKKIYHVFMSSPYIEKLKKENFIGWPNISDALRNSGWNEMESHDLLWPCTALNNICLDKKSNVRISELDLHPNKLGQEVIADYIYENL
jgi:hypothetical protein